MLLCSLLRVQSRYSGQFVLSQIRLAGHFVGGLQRVSLSGADSISHNCGSHIVILVMWLYDHVSYFIVNIKGIKTLYRFPY